MYKGLLEVVAVEVAATHEFARANPLRFPGDPSEMDAIVQCALRNPQLSPPQIVELLEQRWHRRPKVHVGRFLIESHLLKLDGREECRRDTDSLWAPLIDLLWAEDPARATIGYAALQAWLDKRLRRSGGIVARNLLIDLALRLERDGDGDAERKLGKQLNNVLGRILPRTSYALLRKIILRSAEVRDFRQKTTVTDALDELISSIEDTAASEPTQEHPDIESLEAENADLRAALFGLREELTTLKRAIREIQTTDQARSLVDLLAGMNSQPNGRLLDNLSHSSRLVSDLLAHGWNPEPVEVEGVVYSLKMLIDYLARIGVTPVKALRTRARISLSDLALFDYIGSEFKNPDEKKWIEIRSTGWTYQGHVITKPQAVEIENP